jgi:hypothetical protein
MCVCVCVYTHMHAHIYVGVGVFAEQLDKCNYIKTTLLMCVCVRVCL